MRNEKDKLNNAKRFREFMSGLTVAQKAHLLLVIEQSPIDSQWSVYNFNFDYLLQISDTEWNEFYNNYKLVP